MRNPGAGDYKGPHPASASTPAPTGPESESHSMLIQVGGERHGREAEIALD